MPIMLATYSTNKITVLQRVKEKEKQTKKYTLTKHTHTNKQANKEMLEQENTGLIN